MKKILSSFVLFCFTINVMASTNSVQALEKHLDNYEYAMTVEWDQKDIEFQDKMTHRLLTEAKDDLDQVSAADLDALLEKRLGGTKTLEALKLQLKLHPIKNTADISQFLKDHSHYFYNQGASWNGIVIYPTAILIAAIVGFIVLMEVADGPKANCLRYETQNYCYERWDVSGNLREQNCGDHKVCAEYEVFESR